MRAAIALLILLTAATTFVAYGPSLGFLEAEPSPGELAATGPDTTALPAAPVTPTPEPETPSEPGLETFSATIDRSLYQTFANELDAEVADPLTQVVKRLLVWWVDPRRDLRPEDEISVVYRLVDKREPEVVALEFVSSKHARTYQAYSWQAPDARWARFYDAEGREVELRLVDGPIETYDQVTSLLKDGRRHQGVDFRAPVGTPVHAPFDATVSRRNWNLRGNGNCLHLTGPGGVDVLFLHLDRIPDEVRPGARVKKGELVAYSGNTGRSFAPHLHYQLQRGKKVVDPFEYHQTRRLQLDAALRPAFDERRQQLAGLMDSAKAADDS